MAGDYQVWLVSPAGTRMALLDAFTELHYTRSVNDVGSLSITLPYPGRIDLFGEDVRIEVWRSAGGRPFMLDTETCWFLRKRRRFVQDSRRLLQLTCVSAVEMLGRRTVPFSAGSTYTDKTNLHADDLLKAIVREQLGADVADADRQLPGLTVQADQGLAPLLTKSFPERPVLDVMREVCQSSAADESTPTPLFFDVTCDWRGQMRFVTRVGQRGADRSYPAGTGIVELSTELGNLSDPDYTEDWLDERTAVYTGGKPDESSQPIRLVTDPARITLSPYNRREVYIGRTQYTTNEALDYEGGSELRRCRGRKIFAGQILSTPDTEYGLHWFWGDRMTAIEFGERITCSADVVTVDVVDGRETVTAALRSVT